MIPIDAATVCTDASPIQFGASRNAAIVSVADKSRDQTSGGKDDLVVTPGGPRPRDQVQRIKPGETLRQNPDGTFTVVPSDDSQRNDEKNKKPK